MTVAMSESAATLGMVMWREGFSGVGLTCRPLVSNVRTVLS